MKPIVEQCFQTERASLNKFRCPVWHPAFSNPPAATSHLVVFPREAVRITHMGNSPVIAHANVVMLYNQGQEYERHEVSDRGDRCDFFRFDSELIAESVERFDPLVVERPDQPFVASHVVVPDRLYIKQRKLLQRVQRGDFDRDPMGWNLAAVEVLDETVELLFESRGQHSSGRPRFTRAATNHRDLAHEAVKWIVLHFHQKFAVTDLADMLDVSPYHLCRVFREQTKMTVQGFLTSIRLRAALERIHAYRDCDLTELALELGFSSHSHFTARFRKAFGVTPSQWRSQLRR